MGPDVVRVHEQRHVLVRPDAVAVAVLAVVHRPVLVAHHRVGGIDRRVDPGQVRDRRRDRVQVLARRQRDRTTRASSPRSGPQIPPATTASGVAIVPRSVTTPRSSPADRVETGHLRLRPTSRAPALTARRRAASTKRSGLPMPSIGTWYAPRISPGSRSGTSSRVSSGSMTRAPGMPQRLGDAELALVVLPALLRARHLQRPDREEATATRRGRGRSSGRRSRAPAGSSPASSWSRTRRPGRARSNRRSPGSVPGRRRRRPSSRARRGGRRSRRRRCRRRR